MRGKTSTGLLFISVLILSVTIISSTINLVEAPVLPVIYVDPQTTTASTGATITVSIMIDDVEDLVSWEFTLKWYGPVLNVTSFAEGDFLSKGIYETTFVTSYYNGPDVLGRSDYAVVGCGYVGKRAGASGSGILATVSFLVEAEGGSVLDLYKVVLIDSKRSNYPWGMAHSVEDGYLNETPSEFSVVPESTIDPTLVVGEIFSINVSLSDVANLTAFEFKLGYDTTILNATEANIVPFLNEPTSVNKNEINRTAGSVWINVTSTAAETISGSGTVANITFNVIGVGESALDIYGTEIKDKLTKPGLEHHPPTIDGYFNNVLLGHDIVVSKVTTLVTKVTVGDSVPINVTVINSGGFDEAFNVTTFYDGNVIEKKTNIALEAGKKTVLEFVWNTGGVSPGIYTVKAECSQVPNETRTDNNVRTCVAKITVEAVASPIGSFLPYLAAGIAIVVVVAAGLAVYFLKVRKPKPV